MSSAIASFDRKPCALETASPEAADCPVHSARPCALLCADARPRPRRPRTKVPTRWAMATAMQSGPSSTPGTETRGQKKARGVRAKNGVGTACAVRAVNG